MKGKFIKWVHKFKDSLSFSEISFLWSNSLPISKTKSKTMSLKSQGCKLYWRNQSPLRNHHRINKNSRYTKGKFTNWGLKFKDSLSYSKIFSLCSNNLPLFKTKSKTTSLKSQGCKLNWINHNRAVTNRIVNDRFFD